MLALLALASAPLLQESAPAPLPALIESTNALRAFRARYVLRHEGEPDAHFELAYLAPGSARLAVVREEGDEVGRAETWVVDGVMSVRIASEASGPAAGDLDMSEPAEVVAEATRQLSERFPREEAGLGGGPVLVMHWGINPETDKTDFELQLAYEREDRRALLSWLELLRVRGGEPERDGDLLHYRPDERIAVTISATTGFVQLLELTGSDGEVARIELLELGDDPAPERFEVPPRAEDAQELFPDGGARLRGHPIDLRRSAYRRVNDHLERGIRAWDVGSQEDWRAVLVALHERLLPVVFEDWSGRLGQQVEEFGARLAQTAGDPARLEELRAVSARWREALDGSLSEALASFSASLWMDERDPGDLEHLAPLREVEEGVLAELYDELVRGPILARLDELVTEAFGD